MELSGNHRQLFRVSRNASTGSPMGRFSSVMSLGAFPCRVEAVALLKAFDAVDHFAGIAWEISAPGRWPANRPGTEDVSSIWLRLRGLARSHWLGDLRQRIKHFGGGHLRILLQRGESALVTGIWWFDWGKNFFHARRADYVFPKIFSRVMLFAVRIEVLVESLRIDFAQMQVGAVTNGIHGQRHIELHQGGFGSGTGALQGFEPVLPALAVVIPRCKPAQTPSSPRPS